MRFAQRNQCARPGATGLTALHRSLNTPVVALEGFPVGPARAGVALAAGPTGALRLEIAVRSVRTERVLLYAADAEFSARNAFRATEAALSFGEAMGFLFDEDEITAGDPEAGLLAIGHWRDLVGDAFESGDALADGPRLPAHRVLSKFRIGLGSAIAASDGAASHPDPVGAPSGGPESRLEEASLGRF